MRFGLHQYVPQPFSYITMVRDPSSRIVSFYHYIRRSPGHHLNEDVRTRTLSEFAKSALTPELDNLQVRLISGVQNSVPFGECSESLLEEAISNIERYFQVVGLASHFDESLILMKRVLGWGTPFYLPSNRSNMPNNNYVLDEDVRRAIRARNELDQELVEFAKKRLFEVIKPLGREFQLEVDSFRQKNVLYAKTVRPIVHAKKLARASLGRLQRT